jgi:hypothetical protein
MNLIADLLSQGLVGTTEEERRARSLLIGGLTVARAMDHSNKYYFPAFLG